MAAVAAMMILECSTAAADGKKEVYVPMDYSTCGYHASETAIPYVRNVARVRVSEGDSYEALQAAIDYVALLDADGYGRRGAILLDEGTYLISSPLRVSSSGIVIRGQGRGKTTIVKTGVDRGAVIYIEGKRRMTAGDTLDIAGDVKAGATSITLSAAGLSAATLPGTNQRVAILRPSTKEWIEALGMDDFGGGLDYTGWKATDIDIVWHRTITAIDGLTITLDAPITCSIESKYGGGKVITTYNEGEISECGIENLTLQSAICSESGTETVSSDTSNGGHGNPKDEDHCWDGIWMDNARDCWVSGVNFKRLAGSAVNLQKNTSRITVEDCIADEPVSETGGWRRQVFITRGQQTLFQRCVSRHGMHDFAAGFCAAGPNAFVQCEAQEALSFSGSIGSWAPGLLFDIVDIDGNDLKIANLEQFQFGTGWNTANSMLWQCTASTVYCYSPDSVNVNSANGCWGTLTGNGSWTNSNNHVKPRSLFYDQLSKRLNGNGPEGYILPRNTSASSSPTVEQARQMAHLSLTEPRLTLSAWIDSVLNMKEKAMQPQKDNNSKRLKTISADDYKGSAEKASAGKDFDVTDGRLTCDGRLITGDRYHVQWWSGRVKDNYCEKSAKPVITRFVPGREGTGWTDRIDSVVCYLETNNYCMLDHNYGLWYDLRRTDHERIRRADGDVWAPFYEQPFARSGTGTAWDGLSLYDLTKPNRWYWARLKEYADKGAARGMLLFHQNYFQHNILEAGAHWVDCPWRPANNVNGTHFPEPVPFTGDKRVFMAEQFYDTADSINVGLHKQYIRQCLDNFKDNGNVVQLIGEEYTGPLKFVRLWLQTIAEWETETGRKPLIALSCTKDVQDSVLADKALSGLIDIIDIRYWHYNTDSLWAPQGGRNLSPRQFTRKMKPGNTGFDEAYRAVREYREAFPDKAVTFFAQQYQQYGWAILMAGGSLPNVKINSSKLLADIVGMSPVDNVTGCVAIGGKDGCLVYSPIDGASIVIAAGEYNVYTIDEASGNVELAEKAVIIDGAYPINKGICWLENVHSK